jgi:hypothetical protein
MQLDIDEIREDPKLVSKAISSLHWEKAETGHWFIGYGWGGLGASVTLKGDVWVEYFWGGPLNKGAAFRNFFESCMTVMTIVRPGCEVLVGRDWEHGKLLAVRRGAYFDCSPVFWPGTRLDKHFYVFSSEGEMLLPKEHALLENVR